MNVPTSKDPAKVVTKDGIVWVTAAVTRTGRHLYAPEGVASCPQFVMATVEELAEIGIRPMSQELAPSEEDVSPQVAKLRGILAGQRRQQEDPHDGPLASRYTTPHDLPEVTS
ncbi:hypothetical protein ACIPQA_16195 [Streptomyces sp. NPDC090109]|uniref:hypothetical protein n=1 Tax=Streptomyces sp. NPDC090109 TaxID=3365948 RepID=UPI00380791BD